MNKASCALLFLIIAAGAPPSIAAESTPRMQVVQLAGDQVSIRRNGVELTRLNFGKSLPRPFLFPVIGPSGNPLTRKSGNGEAHHNSIWLGHHNINGIDFWTNPPGDSGGGGRIVQVQLENLAGSGTSASVTTLNHWIAAASGETLLIERRRHAVQLLDKGEWMLLVDSQFKAVTDVTFDKIPDGFLGVQMVEPISVRADATYLPGSSLTSNGNIDEDGLLTKPAKWVDYTGPATSDAEAPVEGIAIFDHPRNPNHPSLFKVRKSGWMCTSFSGAGPVKLPKGGILRLRYGVYVHGNQPAAAMEARWQDFAKTEMDNLTPPPAKWSQAGAVLPR